MKSRTAALLLLCLASTPLHAQTNKQVIPHGQSAPPGPALSPQEAIKKMSVPPGFSVELVASEPDIVNPVAMTIDERGRFWITESLEYPKRAAGPGRDRVKVLEDTDNDGKADKFTIAIEGLNIPSGIAVGHGGVWVANSPDILYYPLLDRDTLKLGKPEVVCTGFGRDDTHELPNSLTWGPDGWLYGLNGVFNRSRVKSNNGKTYEFTCALFRIHPRTREFQIFCEGTSNPWGVAFDTEGSAFVSACVIDHLWHLVETGYYHRQGGPYPPFTWKIESIVKHKHQKAAYCGLTFFDSDAYPPEYREKLYMGNIHGNAINCDMLTRDGSTYFAKPGLHPSPPVLRGRGDGGEGEKAGGEKTLGQGVGEGSNFLMANDVWFMPVVQKTGPDGCLYILDWYDRYHCYQDANRDPKGIDRLRGRLYRVRHKDTPRAGKFDLAKESDNDLVERLFSPNVYYRDIAQRLLAERSDAKTRQKLFMLVVDEQVAHKTRLHALWSIIGGPNADIGHVRTDDALGQLLAIKDPSIRSWAVRSLADMDKLPASHRSKIVALGNDPSPDVRLQVAIAARKIEEPVEAMALLLRALRSGGPNDRLIPHIVWQNLHPMLEKHGNEFARVIRALDMSRTANFSAMLPRIVDRLLATPNLSPETMVALLRSQADISHGNPTGCARCLEMIAAKVQSGELAGKRRDDLTKHVLPVLHQLMDRESNRDMDLLFEATFLAASLRDPEGIKGARSWLHSDALPHHRIRALSSLIAAGDTSVMADVERIIAKKNGPLGYRSQVLQALGKLNHPEVAKIVLKHYPSMEPELQPKAVDLLTQRTSWSKQLLAEIAAKKLPTSALNVNQVRKLLASKDAELVKQVTSVWGTVRDGRNPQREQLVAQMREVIRKTPGDAKAGRLHFNKICAQCHKMHGEGQEVGPDITSNGRNDFELLLSNVFDPSLVIGAGYHATTVITAGGQSLSGLVVEDSPQRIVLKTQGGKLETIARGDVDEVIRSKVSYMPEDVEKQLSPREIADLFAYLCLDRPPEHPEARKIPGTPR